MPHSSWNIVFSQTMLLRYKGSTWTIFEDDEHSNRSQIGSKRSPFSSFIKTNDASERARHSNTLFYAYKNLVGGYWSQKSQKYIHIQTHTLSVYQKCVVARVSSANVWCLFYYTYSIQITIFSVVRINYYDCFRFISFRKTRENRI